MTNKRSEVARAMWRETNPPGWEDSPEGQQDWRINGDTFMRMSKAGIEAHEKALEAEGLVIVLREPSDAMMNAGAVQYLGMSEGWAAEVYKAMLAALEGNDE